MGKAQSLVDLSGLQWVRGELDQNLERVHQFIDAYMEAPDDKLPLQRSVIELHQARGILAMVRLHGAALLAEELRQAVHDVLHGVTDNIEPVFEVVLGGAVQLSDYLDFIQTDAVDSALIFHPLINELRVARSKPVVNESELFVRYLLLEPPKVELPELSMQDVAAVSADAKSFQVHFQAALLGILRDRDTQTNLLRLTQICQQLLKGLSEPEVYAQWLYAEAVLESLTDRGQELGLEIKRLLGRLGMLLKYLATEGQASPNAQDKEVAYALLYAVGRSASNGAKVAAVRRAVNLEQLLPDTETLESIRDRLRGPNTSLLETLSSEIRKDIGVVKDNLDLLLRAGDKAPDRLDETVATIRRVATTLDMLGMAALQRVVNRQAEIVDRRRHESEPDQKEWLDAAVSLLWVEHSLDELLFRHVHPDATDVKTPSEEPESDSISPLELREGAASILREALINLSRIKELTNVLLTGYEAESVEEMGHLLHEMSAGLRVIGVDDDEVETLEALRSYVQEPAFHYIGNDEEKTGSFADAVSSLEHYIQALQAHQANSQELFGKCREYISQLELPEIPEAAELPAVEEEAVAETPVVVPVVSDQVDPEIREIFLEEVAEIREMLASQVPLWTHHIDDTVVLGEIRRAFHTLKGSGRMAGAAAIGDYGWAVEQVINACLDGSLPTDHSLVTLVKQATDNLGELVVAYENSAALPANARQVILDAHHITGTEPPVDVVAGGADAQDEEEDLWSIFSKDAEQHLTNLRDFVEASGADMAPQLVTPELVRAFHTLKSGARIVGMTAASRLAGEMEMLADAVRAAGRSMTTVHITLVSSATDALSRVLETRGQAEAVDIEALIAQAQEQLQALPDEAGATDRELMVIYTDEACDLLDNIDAALKDWRDAPEDEHYPKQIIEHSDVLAESSNTAQVTALALVGQEMSRLVNSWLGSQVSEKQIDQLSQTLNGIYDVLDRLRQGAKVEQAGDILSQLQHISVIEDEPTESGTPPAETVVEAAEPVEPVPAPEPVVPSDDAGLSEPETPVTAMPVSATAEVPAKEHMDAELLSLFVEEGDEILESIANEIDRWEQQPANKASILELMRLLHTLKGSARMAGATHIGDLSHGIEDQLTELARTGDAVEMSFFHDLRSASDAIHDELVRYRAGGPVAQADDLPAPTVETTTVQQDVAAGPESRIDDEAVGEVSETPTEDVEPVEATEVPLVVEPEPIAPTMPDTPAMSMPQEAVAEAPVTDVPVDKPVVEAAAEPVKEATRAAAITDTARVPVNKLDQMFNEAGEVGIYLGRMEKQQADLRGHLSEMSQAIVQMRDRIRQLDIEAEAQMQAGRNLSNATSDDDRYEETFDPLEMDRFTRMNELSRSLNESAADLVSLQTLMEEVNSSNEMLLLQQGRITSNLQHGLMNTMLVPFSGMVQRLQRTVRQTSQGSAKQVRLEFDGADSELDRNVLERMVGPLEHLLRNAVVHGIESPEDRQQSGKAAEGRIRVSLRRDGTQSIIEVSDDGRGLDLDSIRKTAIRERLIAEDSELTELELVQMIFEPGFSTATQLTHEAGRGVGMDVVNAEIKQLGGSLNVSFNPGQGTQFLIRIPSSLALTHALLVRVGQEPFAIGMTGIDGIERLPRAELPRYLTEDGPQVLYGGESYRAIRLADLINATVTDNEDEESKNIPVLLMRAGDARIALVVDQVLGGEEFIVKSLGPQVSAIPGVSGGTILADGNVVLIIDVATLYQTRHRRVLAVSAPADTASTVKDERPLVMVVDDSITIRRVTERFLARHGYRVETAKDGMDALPKLQAELPGVVLLDVEMPRIDGFEVATYMRNNENLRDVPIIMITSRSGEKHRKRAADIGVDRYLIKPYQEDELLSNLESVLHARESA